MCTQESRRKQRMTGQPRTWKLTSGDKAVLQQAVDHKLNPEMVVRQLGNYNTNKVEAFHNRCLKYNPKSKQNKKTFSSRNLHAVTIERLGIASGTRAYQAKCGMSLNGPGQKITKQMDLKSSYHSFRQKSVHFKRQRHKGKLKKIKLKMINKFLSVKSAEHEPSKEHNYCC